MLDHKGRKIEYVRLSVTQNCNLHCIYCNPAEGEQKEVNCVGLTSEGEQKEVNCSGLTSEREQKEANCASLTSGEFELIVKSMAKLGINKVRITGGEPTLRPDLCEIISRIARVEGIKDISLTTNGIRLAGMAAELKEAGLHRINISLDSLEPQKFKYMTGGGDLNVVLKGIESALEVGFHPVKINVVLVKGVNDEEVLSFIKLAREHALDVRFIELMPIGSLGENNRDKIIYNSEILTNYGAAWFPDTKMENGPAKNYRLEDFKGRIGLISPMSHQFCDSCNRIRVTCEGKIRPCLGNNGEVDIKDILNKTPEALDESIEKIIFNKPEGHHFGQNSTSLTGMKSIGG